MRYFRIKVCGITRVKDAQLVSNLGADLIGFIFYKRSLRHVSPTAAAKIIRSIDPVVRKVGVFVDEESDQILRIAERASLDVIQLHGSETALTIKRLQREGYMIIKAFSPCELPKLSKSPADLIMLDNRTENEPGGTGQRFNWELTKLKGISNLVLAGGISADNVARGVEHFEPLVVDVNSGVESRAGIKSGSKLKRFFEICNKVRYGK